MIESDKLGQLTTMAAKLLSADGCMIMLIERAAGDRLTFTSYSSGLPACAIARKRWTRHVESAAQEAIRTGKTLQSDWPAVERTADTMAQADSMQSITASPIRVRSNIVGAVNVISAGKLGACDPEGLAAAEIVAWLVGQSLHAGQLETLLDSRFAQLAIVAEAGSGAGQALALAGTRPAQLARILAKSFYREMVKLGCDSNQIIGAASEIISQLSGSLKRHQTRWQRTSKSRDGAGE